MRIVWHRGDLRVHDHPALAAAASAGPVVGLVVLDPNILASTSARRRALFQENVRALRSAYQARGGILAVRFGEPSEELVALADALQEVEAVHAIASYTPYGVHRDGAVVDALREVGLGVRWHDGAYVHTPGTVRTSDDGFYSVFSPFHRRWRSLGWPDPLPAPDAIPAPDLDPGFDPGDIAGQATDVQLPEPGETAALEALEGFVRDGLDTYADHRDRLDGSGTSRLSVWLTIGALSARTAAARVEAAGQSGEVSQAGAAKWLAELAWRNFMADLLYHRPDMLSAPFRSKWTAMDWPGSDADLEAWKEARTGIPAVDAAMRQLKETGWISNRARMIAAQFLAKNLRVDWRRGEQVFKHWLLDGDTANNVGNWQWAAGLGVDNAPYFRVMNPVSQAGTHDPEGRWLRRWAPKSDGDPSPSDPIADPKASRKAYLETAGSLPANPAPDPAPRRPRLALATRAQLTAVAGVGPETADAILEAVAEGTIRDLEGLSHVGPVTAAALNDRFEIA